MSGTVVATEGAWSGAGAAPSSSPRAAWTRSSPSIDLLGNARRNQPFAPHPSADVNYCAKTVRRSHPACNILNQLAGPQVKRDLTLGVDGRDGAAAGKPLGKRPSACVEEGPRCPAWAVVAGVPARCSCTCPCGGSGSAPRPRERRHPRGGPGIMPPSVPACPTKASSLRDGSGSRWPPGPRGRAPDVPVERLVPKRP